MLMMIYLMHPIVVHSLAAAIRHRSPRHLLSLTTRPLEAPIKIL